MSKNKMELLWYAYKGYAKMLMGGILAGIGLAMSADGGFYQGQLYTLLKLKENGYLKEDNTEEQEKEE